MSADLRLSELRPGDCARIISVGGEGALRQHFLDMGIIPGSCIRLEKFAPMGDPLEISIHSYELTLRIDDAYKIKVDSISLADYSGRDREGQAINSSSIEYRTSKEHPGLGEYGKFHDRAEEDPLPDNHPITFALIGNQNCGKTTLFNQLTGMNQHVGNFPGVTVDKKIGQVKGYQNVSVVDLPGIYSLSPYTSEEVISRQFILGERPEGIINIVDATNIERNLYLTMQLLELGVPVVLALNMMDELHGNGGSIDINAMEESLGIPVVPISAISGEGVHELIQHAVHVAKYQESPLRKDFCLNDGDGAAVHRCLHGIMHLVEDHALAAGIPPRFAAAKLVEGDSLVAESLNLGENEIETIEHIVTQMEIERRLDRSAAMADMRYSFIESVCRKTVVKARESKERARSQAVDRILTGTYTAIPAFILVMAAIFWLTFSVVGFKLQSLLQMIIDSLGSAVSSVMESAGVNPVLQSLVTDGVFGGVGVVVSFIPIIVVLFFFLSLLEDSGYMARVAFVMDKLLRKLGLSGRSIVPLLIGFGCSVPSVMASRTLPSERDRKMTIMLTPFMSCTAKLPIYAFFTAAFFPEHAAIVMVGLYFLGIVMGVLVALVSKRFAFQGEAIPFVMELPNYRMPSIRSVALLLWEKTADFLQRAFTIIFVASLVVWFLQTFDFTLNVVSSGDSSMLARIAGVVSPIFVPLGFGDWRISTALVTGFITKESVVATLSVLFGSTSALLASISVPAALALLVFCLLYTPCIATVAAIKRELGLKWAAGIVVMQCVVAWVCSFVVHFLASLFIL